MASSELKDGKTYRTREGRLLEAIIAVADADAEDDRAYHRAWVRWRKAMVECGWKPPRAKPRPGVRCGWMQLSLWKLDARLARDLKE
jgi:hypothetical protein